MGAQKIQMLTAIRLFYHTGDYRCDYYWWYLNWDYFAWLQLVVVKKINSFIIEFLCAIKMFLESLLLMIQKQQIPMQIANSLFLYTLYVSPLMQRLSKMLEFLTSLTCFFTAKLKLGVWHCGCGIMCMSHVCLSAVISSVRIERALPLVAISISLGKVCGI